MTFATATRAVALARGGRGFFFTAVTVAFGFTVVRVGAGVRLRVVVVLDVRFSSVPDREARVPDVISPRGPLVAVTVRSPPSACLGTVPVLVRVGGRACGEAMGLSPKG